jgi:hypothetical protein
MAVIVRKNVQQAKRVLGRKYQIIPAFRAPYGLAKQAALGFFSLNIIYSPGRPEFIHRLKAL